ncbi:alpha/beta hydrolase [Akkermansiaceae bacterium]|nr:alpha/beta hydrolase [Akkermansiaceae bacterium]
MLRSRFLSLLTITTASLAGGAASALAAPAARFTLRKDIAFTPEDWHERLEADLYVPDSAPAPAVLLIHGGGWNGRERRSDMAGIARLLAKRGYFVMNTTYRLTPEWKFPAQADDIRLALRFMRENAADLNIDPGRIATFGYSAGGHLAALAGFDKSNRIKAIVAGGAPSDLRFWPDGRLTGLLLGGPVKGNEALYRAASPVEHVERGGPPVFIYHGTADDLVPMEHPKALIAALERKGVPHETYWIEGRSHIMAHLFPAAAIRRAAEFLDANL